MYSELSRTDYSLRDYQQAAKNEIFAQWDHVSNVMYQMPTGTGKTRLFTSIIRDLTLHSIEINRRCGILIIAHRTELIEQIDASLDKYRIPHGIIAGSFKDRRNLMLPVQVASIQTITHPSNYELAKAFNADYIIIDEAHHAVARSYSKLWSLYPDSKKLGVTATPWRMDGRGFRPNFDVMVPSESIKKFLNDGWLAPYFFYSVPIGSNIRHEIDSITKFGIDGDYQTSALESVIDTNKIRAQLIDSYLKFANGKKGIIYSISKAHSKHICRQYSDIGINIADIDSDTPSEKRKQLVSDFKEGKIDILVNVDIFSEGFDCPDLEFVQLARPTRSLVKYIQQIGRGLRRNGDKKCIILDNVGMYERFGLPDDERPWNDYFLGSADYNGLKDNHNSKSKSSDVVRVPTSKNLSEGTDEMLLIQSIDLSVEKEVQISPKSRIIEDPTDYTIKYSAMSPTIFSKYKVIEDSDGYYLCNIRTEEKQYICSLQGRTSISLKSSKVDNKEKTFAIISSFNRNKKPSPNDRIIGYLYKVGSILRFKHGEAIIDITV